MTESFNEHSSLSELFSDSSLPGEGEQPSISRLQYLDKTDLLNKSKSVSSGLYQNIPNLVSHAIFEDFHQNSNAHYEGEDSIAQYLSQFVEVSTY
jgi:hypothetical protein